ncbi:hypothetical protein Plhal304r1_c011g0043991 [Plasmopara halstedii]
MSKSVVGCATKQREKLQKVIKRREKRAHRRAQDKNSTFATSKISERGLTSPGIGDVEEESGKLQSKIVFTDILAKCYSECGDGGLKFIEDASLLDCENVKSHDLRDDPTSENYVNTDLSGEAFKDIDHHGEQCYLSLKMMIPNPSYTVSTDRYETLKKKGERHLREIIESLQGEQQVSSTTSGSDLWSSWDIDSDICAQEILHKIDTEIQTEDAQRLLSSEPRRMHCGWSEARRPRCSLLFEQSAQIYTKMTRSVALMLIPAKKIVVPDIFSVDWLKDDICVSRSSAECGEGLQQFMLPSDLVRQDGYRIDQAPSKITSAANSYLCKFRRSDISLTCASMNIPNIWEMNTTLDILAELVTEHLRPMSDLLESTTCTQNDEKVPEKLYDSEQHSKNWQDCSDDRITAKPADQPLVTDSKSMVIAENSPLNTDYFLSDQFLKCNWSRSSIEADTYDITSAKDTVVNGSERPLNQDQLLQQIARPALWDLMRKKLIQANETSIKRTLSCISLEELEALIFQQFLRVKSMCINPSAYSSIEIVEACTSLRQASWLHTLRAVLIYHKMNGAYHENMTDSIVNKILSSAIYRLLLGDSNWKDLIVFLRLMSGRIESSSLITEPEADTCNINEENQPTLKRQKILQSEIERIPVRVLCSIKFLEQDELLDELCTEQQIFFIERDLSPPIDILVDESNCICMVTEDTFQVEAKTRNFIFSLARLQLQLHKCWLVITIRTPPSAEIENRITSFCSALVQFRISIQVLTSFSCEETGRLVRAVVDECADVAMNEYRILPRVWFERPFLLEEESQFERFLVSTNIINQYSAQSLLHRISLDDLFSKSINDIKHLVKGAVTDNQLMLLWRFVQQDHGLR